MARDRPTVGVLGGIDHMRVATHLIVVWTMNRLSRSFIAQLRLKPSDSESLQPLVLTVSHYNRWFRVQGSGKPSDSEPRHDSTRDDTAPFRNVKQKRISERISEP